jgi:hypothetical protein
MSRGHWRERARPVTAQAASNPRGVIDGPGLIAAIQILCVRRERLARRAHHRRALCRAPFAAGLVKAWIRGRRHGRYPTMNFMVLIVVVITSWRRSTED